MSRIRGHGNKDTEIAMIKLLRRHEITGWRRYQPLFGKPDFIFQKERLAIFVDGCFWHFCPKHGRNPNTNRDYWLPKLRRNQERDKAVKQNLSKAGWIVLRFWEHELLDETKVSRRINKALFKARTRLQFGLR